MKITLQIHRQSSACWSVPCTLWGAAFACVRCIICLASVVVANVVDHFLFNFVCICVCVLAFVNFNGTISMEKVHYSISSIIYRLLDGHIH